MVFSMLGSQIQMWTKWYEFIPVNTKNDEKIISFGKIREISPQLCRWDVFEKRKRSDLCRPTVVGYPNFVEFYSRKFYEMCSKDLSEKGAFWCSETRRCLIEQANEGLLGRGSDQKRPTCADVHNFGFDSHPGCYTQRHVSFCDLSVEDIAHVIRVIKVRNFASKIADVSPY
jgi:hypothetical protein